MPVARLRLAPKASASRNLFIRDVELQVAVPDECDCTPRRHISGRPAFLKPSTKWSLTDASRSGWELSQWAIVK